MQLYLGGACEERVIKYSHFGHWSEKGARQREGINKEYGLVNDWDWIAVAKMSRSVTNHIRKKLATAKEGSRPILAFAADLQNQGFGLLKY